MLAIFISYSRHNIWELQLSNGNVTIKNLSGANLESNQGRLGSVLEEHVARYVQTNMNEPIKANIQAQSTHFRSDITIDLQTWLPEIFLIIKVII